MLGSIVLSTLLRHSGKLHEKPPVVVVQSGDTLSGLAYKHCGDAGDWTGTWEANKKLIKDPNLIYPGWHVNMACLRAHVNLAAWVPAPSAPADPPAAAAPVATDPPDGTPVSQPAADPAPHLASSSGLSGTLGCSGLEQLWIAAGGNPGVAVTAASIAMAESGGNQDALSSTNDYGYWQINGSHGALATFDPMGNAQAAIIISSDGTNWTPWTTYTSGAYAGRC